MIKLAILAVVSALALPALAVTPAFNYGAEVGSSVTPVGQRWDYAFAVTNKTNETFCCLPPAIKDFSLPYFSDAGIAEISAPTDWNFEILGGNPFGLKGADILHWFTSTPSAELYRFGAAGIFGFTADFAAAKGPFQVAFSNAGTLFGDPSVPASPMALAAGLRPIDAVPEPSQLVFWLLGLACLCTIAWRQHAHRKTILA